METANIPPLKSEYAEKKLYIIVSAIGLILGSIPITSAQSSLRNLGQTAFEPPKGSTKVESAAEAAQLPVGTALLFKCDRCGGSQSVAVDEGKTQLAWFGGKAKKCPGQCGGWCVTRACDHRPEVIILIFATLALAVENRPFHGPLPSQHAASRILEELGWRLG